MLDPAALDLDFTAGLEDILSSNDDSMASFVFDAAAAVVGGDILTDSTVAENQVREGACVSKSGIMKRQFCKMAFFWSSSI